MFRVTSIASLAALGIGAVLALAPGDALASQAFLDYGTQARLVAGGGENNEVTAEVVNGGTAVKFIDLEDITQTNCTMIDATSVLCQSASKISSVSVTTGSLDDAITVHTASAPVRVRVDAGKDADTVLVTGIPASDTIYGGLGEDDITASDANSFVWSGQLGAGGSDADTVVLGGGINSLYGGDDADHVTGGPAKDTVYGEEGDDWVSTGTGNDVVYGGIGSDALFGGTGADELRGQDGNDWLDALDGVADPVVHCGPGTDTVYHDAADGVANCELP
jgi:Ca2+-binding RTX toxin-like protein